jgi:hypothetical protein
MMDDKRILELALGNVEIQIKATLALLSGGRSANGNAFDFNNLMACRKTLQELLAAQPSEKK